MSFQNLLSARKAQNGSRRFGGFLRLVFLHKGAPFRYTASMEVTLRIPDDLAHSLAGAHGDLSRQALEALAVDGYRRGLLTQFQVSQLLSLSRVDTEDFLARQVDLYDYDPAELDREAQALENLSDRTR